LNLTDSQRQGLQRYRDHDPRLYVRECCAALLKIAMASRLTQSLGTVSCSRVTQTPV
jgi:hypothetical protein